jgi:hypothetical protein
LGSTFRQWIYRRSLREWSIEYFGDTEQYHEYGRGGHIYSNAYLGSCGFLCRGIVHCYGDIEPDAINNGNDSYHVQRDRIYGNTSRRNQWDSTIRDNV